MFACIYCPELPADLSLIDFAYSFSPLVEETYRDTVVLDAEGCELLFGSTYELANEIAERAVGPHGAGGLECKVNVAVAANPDTAIYAARFYKGITFISPEEELTGIGDLPIDSFKLPFSPSLTQEQLPTSKPPIKKSVEFGDWTLEEKQLAEIIETLRLWGVRTFHDFAVLPVTGIAERLGQTGVRLQQLARGKTERHLKLKQPAPVFHYSLELEHSIVQLEALSFIFARLLNQLCATLDTYAFATNELHVKLKLDNQESHERILNLPRPMRDNKIFLKLLLLDMEMHPPASAIVAISIGCDPVKPQVLQNGLFIPLAPEPEKLELTLLRLTKLLGSNNVGAAELIDTHRPDAFQIKRFSLSAKVKTRRQKNSQNKRQGTIPGKYVVGFRMFRPPLKAMVEATRGYPTQISAWSKQLSVYGKIVNRAGPWRTTGDWWRLNNWARDEWDVTVESRASFGAVNASSPGLYRIYRDLRDGAWFVEGNYD